MKNKKKHIRRSVMAVYMSAALVTGMISSAVPAPVQAQADVKKTPGAVKRTGNMTWRDGTVIEANTDEGIYELAGGTKKDPLVITVEGTVTVPRGIYITSGYVKFTGSGTLKWTRNDDYDDEYDSYLDSALGVEAGADVTFENVILDGNSITFYQSAFLLEGNVSLSGSTQIRNFFSRTAGSGGTVLGRKGVIAVYGKGVLDIYDGVSITGNKSESGIIALYQMDDYDSANPSLSTATVNMYGGSITGNTVRDTPSPMGVIWNWCGNLNIFGGEIIAQGGEYAVHTQGNADGYNAATRIAGGTFTGEKNGAVCAGKEENNKSSILIAGGVFSGKTAATVNYGTITIRGGQYTGSEYALSSNGNGSLEVYGGEFMGGTAAYQGSIQTQTQKVIVGENKASAQNWDKQAALNGFKYVAIGEIPEKPAEHTHTEDAGTETAEGIVYKCTTCGFVLRTVVPHKHNDITWEAWTETDRLPDTAGNYYLTEDVTLSDNWLVPKNTTNLCLNGNSIRITKANTNAIAVYEGYSQLNLYNCTDGGHVEGVQISNSLAGFAMYGGEISGVNGSYGGVQNHGNFVMYGGKITQNQATFGGGVLTSGTFSMLGGEISGNISENGGAVYISGENGSIMVGGSAVIWGNKDSRGNQRNVYLYSGNTISISDDRPLTDSAHIGISTQVFPSAGNDVAVTGKNAEDYSARFQSDSPAYKITGGLGAVVKLVKKPDVQPPKGEITVGGAYWEEFQDNITFETYFKQAETLTITATDEGEDGAESSGVDTIAYHLSDRVLTKAEVQALGRDDWTEQQGESVSITIKPDRKCVIYVKITDKAGNAAYLSSTGLVFDKTAPVISGIKDGKTYRSPQTVTVTEDNLASVKVNGKAATLEDNKFTMEAVSGEQTVTATDKAGNRTSVTVRIKTEQENVNDAKKVVEDALQGITPSNDTTKKNIQDAVDAALDAEGLSVVTATVGEITKTEATTDDAGSIRGSITIQCGDKSGSAAVDLVIAKLPSSSTESGSVDKDVDTDGKAPAAQISTPTKELADIVLTEEEKKQMEDGDDIKIILSMKDASDTVSSTDKALVEAVLDGYTVGQYLDISLFKLIGEKRSAISETKKRITIVITIPDSLKNADSKKRRTYEGIRVHDGKAEILADLDEKDDTITIATDCFSTYAIAYKDTAASDGSGDTEKDNGKDTADEKNDNKKEEDGSVTKKDDNKKSNTSKKKSTKSSSGSKENNTRDDEPKTGDTTPIELYATIAMIAGLSYLRLYFADHEGGMTEKTKKELVLRIITWAERGGKIRKLPAIVAIVVLLVYYHTTKNLYRHFGKESQKEEPVYGK